MVYNFAAVSIMSSNNTHGTGCLYCAGEANEPATQSDLAMVS